MSENDQPQEPLNTRMSDETGGVEIQSNARGDAITDIPERQIFTFADLLNLGELDRYSEESCLQKSLANVLPRLRKCFSRYAHSVNGC